MVNVDHGVLITAYHSLNVIIRALQCFTKIISFVFACPLFHFSGLLFICTKHFDFFGMSLIKIDLALVNIRPVIPGIFAYLRSHT
ncbi:hypothetical protein ACUY4R_001843 [Kosakonia sp. BK9b]